RCQPERPMPSGPCCRRRNHETSAGAPADFQQGGPNLLEKLPLIIQSPSSF
ncbi:Hypothetical predicted protein, partial [Podarcis lilfordi]